MNYLKAAGVTFLIIISGCARFRAPQFQAPAGFSADARAAQLVNPATRASAWEALCPPRPPKLQFTGKLIISGAWRLRKDLLNTNYFAFRPGQGEPTVRFNGFSEAFQVTVFDLLVYKGRMRVVVPPKKAGFEGPIPKEGSPFRVRYGVEPWQLNNIFLIGRAMATNRFKQTTEGKKLVVVPNDRASTDTPARIELDAKTGLPLRAVWSANGQNYEVKYFAWDWFKNVESEETGAATPPHLMPKHLQIQRAKPKTLLDLNIDHYKFGVEVPPQLLTTITTERIQMHPLAELKDALE